MLTAIKIDREVGDGKYGDVLDAIEVLADGDYGSGANAACVMIRQSPLFKAAIAKLRKQPVDSVPQQE